MSLKVECLSCQWQGTPISRGELDDDNKEPKWNACKCGAILTRQENGTMIVHYRTDGPHGVRPFAIFDPKQRAEEEKAREKAAATP